MIDLKKYVKDGKKIEFLETIREDLSLTSQSEVFLKHKNFCFMLEPHGEEIEVLSDDKSLGLYKNIDDLLLNFLIDGKPFIERISEIEYD